MLRDAERLRRELADHLQRGFAPKADALAALTDLALQNDPDSVAEDITVYNGVKTVLDSDEFSRTILKRFRKLLNAVDTAVQGIASAT